MRTRLAVLLTFLLAFSIFVAQPVQAQQPAAAHSKPWIAQWITAPDAPQRDESVLHFRKIMELAQLPQHFVVNVSADNQYILYINQQRAGSGPSRSDLHHWRYETYDIAPMLHEGKNVLGATVWNFGTHSALAQMSDRIGFLLHGASDAERIADSDATWEVEKEKGIGAYKQDVRGYYAAEPGERLDGAVYDWNWQDPSRTSANWVKAVSLGRGALREETDAPNNWQLVADPLPAMETKELTGGRLVRATGIDSPTGFPGNQFTVPPHTKASVLLDNGQLTTAYPSLRIGDGLGAKLRMTYAEALLDDKGEKGNRNQIEGKRIAGVTDEFLSGGQASSEFTPLVWRTWRYLQLDIEIADQPLTIHSLRAGFTAYPFKEEAHFQSDDETLSRIWEVGWRTARLDAHDTYMDTPYWERLQYVGDTRIQALISYTVAGDDRLARQAINAYNYSRLPEGITQSRYPSSLTQVIPTFSLLWVGMVHDHWMYRGNADFVQSQLQGTRAALDWYLQRQRPDGLLASIPWWPFVDWGTDFDFGRPPQDEDGGSSVITLQFIEALRYAAEMEAAVGDAHYSDVYRAAADRAAKAVYDRCWSRQYGLLADTPAQKHFSQHANILGVWLDVIPASQQRDVLTKILSTSDAGFKTDAPLPGMTAATYYFRFYLARALEHAKLGDQYLQLLEPWRTMLDLGLTTWAESPEPTRSDSHAWSAHPNYDLLTIVAGICPESPGFKSVRIEPHLGNLTHVSAAMPAPQGKIVVEYTRTQSGVEATANLPAGVSGHLNWDGKKIGLHEGAQHLTLPQKTTKLSPD
jgi:alpha-L-rhamnosidase